MSYDDLMTLQDYVNNEMESYKFKMRNTEFNDTYRQRIRQETIDRIQTKKNSLLESKLEKITEDKNKLVKQYSPKPIQDPTLYLANRKMQEDRISLLSNEELDQSLNAINQDSDPDLAEWQLLEAKKRNNPLFDSSNAMMKSYNLRSKHLNDPVYKDLLKEEIETNRQLKDTNYFFLNNWKNDMKQIKSIDQILDSK